MGLVNVIFRWDDGVIDNLYTEVDIAYRINEKDVLCKEGGSLVIRQISFETEEGIIIDFEKTEENPNELKPIYIELENINGIDFTNESVINFAKYLIQIRDGE